MDAMSTSRQYARRMPATTANAAATPSRGQRARLRILLLDQPPTLTMVSGFTPLST
jgi:hypothetical protein